MRIRTPKPGTSASSMSQAARAAGMRMATPSLEAVEKRRIQMWTVMFSILVGLSAVVIVTSFWTEALPLGIRNFASMPVLRICLLAVTVAFCIYVMEKERMLRSITRALIDERVLTAALTNRVTELASLSEVAKAINSVLTTKEVLGKILSSALNLLHASEGRIMLVDRERNVLRSVCEMSALDDPVEGADEIALGEGIPGWVAHHREPLLVSRGFGDGLFARLVPADSPVQSAMCVALINRGELLGILYVSSLNDTRSFGEYDLRALQLFAENAAVAISNARLFEAERAHVAKLQEVDAQRQEFVATVSHELRSPLTSIIGSARTLRKRGSQMPAEQTAEFLTVIERQSDRLLQLIDDILFASRIEAGENRLRREPLEVARVVEEVVTSFKARDRLGRVRLVAPARQSLMATGDPNGIHQVLTNLLDNALKYAPGESPVTVTIADSDGEVAITVSDHGPGIPKADLPHIFERFRQANANSGTEPGVGLGLYITANLVAGMGGRIWVQSEEAHGSAFTFTLPTFRRETAPGVLPAAPVPPVASGLTAVE